METINKILLEFNAVFLSQTEEVKLMNRIDRKYWFHISDLEKILENSTPLYDVLEINGQRLMDYKTTYFDTPDNKLYKFHHNRKLNRYKIRKRKYFSTNSDFLEIKQKTNKQRTIKERIKSTIGSPSFSVEEMEFVNRNPSFAGLKLSPALFNQFQRITLVNKNKTDRCTLDINLEFENTSGKVKFENLVVVEIKRGQSLKSSSLLNLLREKKVRQRGLSKYCTGRAILEPNLKQNAFKPRLRYLKKEILFHRFLTN